MTRSTAIALASQRHAPALAAACPSAFAMCSAASFGGAGFAQAMYAVAYEAAQRQVAREQILRRAALLN